MPAWDSYPSDYRQKEIDVLLAAARGGECSAVIGLSGAGKSNLLGCLAHRAPADLPLALVDCNRLQEPTPGAFFRLALRGLQPAGQNTPIIDDELGAFECALQERLDGPSGRLCLVFDRFDCLPDALQPAVHGSLRALRDDHKYDLTYITAARRPLDASSELAELFFGHILWLGALAPSDAAWSARRYAERKGLQWDAAVVERLTYFSGGYPSLLRGSCEACALGCPLELEDLRIHPAVQQRLAEFWADEPTPQAIDACRLADIPLLAPDVAGRSAGVAIETLPGPVFHTKPASELFTAGLTAKENALLAYLTAHPNQVCKKDDLIAAVWPEDRLFIEGIRDDSLAQLVRRLRLKVEPDPARPIYIHNAPGRGYRFTPRS